MTPDDTNTAVTKAIAVAAEAATKATEQKDDEEDDEDESERHDPSPFSALPNIERLRTPTVKPSAAAIRMASFFLALGTLGSRQ